MSDEETNESTEESTESTPRRKPASRAKKATAKKTAKKKTTTKKAAAPKSRKAIGTPVKEVFTVDSPTYPSTVEVPANSVLLFINGRDKGTVDTTRQKLGEFAVAQAQRAGIRSFSIYVDGLKADTSDAGKPMTGIAKIEIVSKDTRG